jgi:hypothetical protein
MIARTIGRFAAALAFAVVLLGGSGCVSAKYKLAKGGMPPPVALNLTASQPPVEAAVNAVIVLHGPGSWKREAYWDEYAVAIANRGAAPITVESASLIDFQDIATAPGDDPWKLEAVSKTWWQKVKASESGNLLALGAGAVGASGVLLAAAIAADGGFLAPATAAGNLLAGAAAATLAAAPIYAVTVVVINSKNKHQVAAEFDHRRMKLPRTIAPGEIAQGSLFFRVSPAPKRLILKGHGADEPRELAIDLAPLAGLHLKPKPVPPPGAASTTAPAPVPSPAPPVTGS